jgi:tRNA pseudouridine38-40 synthase
MKNKYFYKLKVSFNGAKYLGWQIQKDFHPTVQGTFNKACESLFKTTEIKTIGSGRTDTGVHSLGHIVKLEAPLEIPYEGVLRGLNSVLPSDIRVLEVSACDEGFLPTNHAKRKTYKYLFTNNKATNPFHADLIANISFDLNFDVMEQACEIFVGEHDFSDFQCTGSEVATTVREIYSCKLYQHKTNLHGIIEDHWVFEVTGSGFLKQMVRLMMGTLWNIGKGNTTISELQKSLQSPQGKRLGAVAPACGLYKVSVEY